MIALLVAATAVMSVRSQKAEVGDPLAVTVKVAARPGAVCTIELPPSEPPAFTVEAGGQRLVQADAEGNATFTWRIVPWADGDTTIPPVTVEVGGIGSLRTEPVTIHAFNPLGADAKDQQPKDIRDIRPFPRRLPVWIFGALGFLAAAFLWFAMRRRAPAPPPKREVLQPVPPKVMTLGEWIEAVRRIAESPPRDPAELRAAHFTIAEAVRRFVEERWEIPASKQTTEEFLEGIARSTTFRGGGMSILPVVLEACDRVKWAGESAGAQDTLEVARLALDFFAASRASIRGLGGLDAGSAAPQKGVAP
jgi:hypothetical protein